MTCERCERRAARGDAIPSAADPRCPKGVQVCADCVWDELADARRRLVTAREALQECRRIPRRAALVGGSGAALATEVARQIADQIDAQAALVEKGTPGTGD